MKLSDKKNLSEADLNSVKKVQQEISSISGSKWKTPHTNHHSPPKTLEEPRITSICEAAIVRKWCGPMLTESWQPCLWLYRNTVDRKKFWKAPIIQCPKRISDGKPGTVPQLAQKENEIPEG